MNEQEVVKLIKSKEGAVAEALLLSGELTDVKVEVEKFLDKNLMGDSLLGLRYRKFKATNKSSVLWSNEHGYPVNGQDWIKPYIDFFEKFLAEKRLKNRLENENLWVESVAQGEEQHLMVGEKSGTGEKVHVIFGETGEIRIDKKDQSPAELFKKIEGVLTRPDGTIIKSTVEFFKEKVE